MNILRNGHKAKSLKVLEEEKGQLTLAYMCVPGQQKQKLYVNTFGHIIAHFPIVILLLLLQIPKSLVRKPSRHETSRNVQRLHRV